METIYNVLNNYLKGSCRNGINDIVARYLLANLNRVPDMRLAEVAQHCHTSTPSVIRFCRELGYDDFTDFKQHVSAYMRKTTGLVSNYRVPLFLDDEDQFRISLNDWLNHLTQTGTRAMISVNRDQVRKLMQEIHRYQYVYVIGAGLSGVVGEHLRIRLALCGKTIISISPPKDNMILSLNKNETLCLLVSQKGHIFNENKQLFSTLKNNCSSLWIITLLPDSRVFTGANVIYLKSGSGNWEEEYHILTYFSELLGESYQKMFGHNDPE